MNYKKIIFTFLIVLFGYNYSFACDLPQSMAIEKVLVGIQDFNTKILNEMDYSTAYKKYFFFGEVDTIDARFGLKNNFLEVTKNVTKKDKSRYFILENLQSFAFPLMSWKLAKSKDSTKIKFSEIDIGNDKEFDKIFIKELKNFGLTEESLDDIGNLSKDNIDFHEKFSTSFTSTIAKQIDRKTLDKNILYLNKKIKVIVVDFEGRNYFEVENRIFKFKVALKDCVPKIMSINRNYTE